MDSSVQLRTRDLFITEDSREPLELAVLSGSILMLLGDKSTVAPHLAGILAGREKPYAGSVLIGSNQVNVTGHPSNGIAGYVPWDFSCPAGMTVSEFLSLSSAAAGYSRKESPEIISQLLSWCSLTEYGDRQVGELKFALRIITGFAAACLPAPEILVLKGPFPWELHPLMEDLCESGCSIIASVPGIEYIPPSTARIAICDGTDVSRILRQGELEEACSQLMRINVAFFPALPRAVMESLSGAKDIMAVDGGYEFHHSNLSAAVTNLTNLARANSRQISGLEIRPPSSTELSELLREEEDDGEVDLFAQK